MRALHDPYRPTPPPPIDGSLLDLMATDHFVDSRKGYHDPDASLLSDLAATDAEIDSSKAVSRLKDVASSGEGQVIADLLAVDRLVDKRGGGEATKDDLVDDCRSSDRGRILHPPDVYSTAATSDACTMMSLLFNDELVDGKRRALAERESVAQSLILELLAVDVEMGSATRRNGTVGVMQELGAIDAAIDGARSASAERTVTTDAANRPFHNMKRKSTVQNFALSAIEADLAAVGLTGAIADMYALDRRIDGAADATHRRDEVSSILELYDIDVVVNNAAAKKTGSSDSDPAMKDFMELLSVDRAIDGAKAKSSVATSDEEVDLVDPTAGATMRQITLLASRDLHDEASMEAVMDLLRVDLDIEGQRHYEIAMEGITAMLKVDRFVDGSKAAASRRHDISDVLELLAVDREVDLAKAARDSPKTTAQDDIDPMEALLATDRLIDGTNERLGKNKTEAILSDLRRVDLSVDNLFMPDLPGMMGPPSPQGLTLMDVPPPGPPTDEATAPGKKRSIFSGEEKKGVPSYERQTKDAIRELYKIDQKIDGKKMARSTESEMSDVLDLWKVDVEVDKAKVAANRKGSERPPSSPVHNPRADSAKVAQDNAQPKRSIFSCKEKKGAALTNIVGTTTVVDGRERIGSIPIGRSVMSDVRDEFFGQPEMAPPSRGDNAPPLKMSKKKDGKPDQCSVM